MSLLSHSPAALCDAQGLLRPPVLAWISQQQHAVLLETSRPAGEERRTMLFLQPQSVVQCARLEEVEASLRQIQRAVDHGYYAAGFLSYEAGYAFEERLALPPASPLPLLWFGIYQAPWIYDCERRAWESGEAEAAKLDAALREAEAGRQQTAALEIAATISEAEHHHAVAAIKNHIAAGDTYQVNFTFKM